MCSTGLQALHLENCLNLSCKSVNHFKQESKPNQKDWIECFKELNRLFNWIPQPK